MDVCELVTVILILFSCQRGGFSFMGCTFENMPGMHVVYIGGSAVAVAAMTSLECAARCCQLSMPACRSYSFYPQNLTCMMSPFPGEMLQIHLLEEEIIVDTNVVIRPGCYDESYLMNPYSATCYNMYGNLITHADATALCHQKDEHLASFLTLESFEWMENIMIYIPGWKNRAWIGLKKDSNTGQYYWSGDGNSTLEYDMWGPYDPNDHTSCILMYEESMRHDFRFGDESCGQASSVLCESQILWK